MSDKAQPVRGRVRTERKRGAREENFASRIRLRLRLGEKAHMAAALSISCTRRHHWRRQHEGFQFKPCTDSHRRRRSRRPPILLSWRSRAMALRPQELLQNAGSAVGVAEVPNLKVLLGAADLSGLVQRTLASMTGALSSVGLVILFVAFLLASRATINSKIAIVAASSSREKRFNAVLKQVDRGVRDCVLAQTMSAALIAGGAGVVMLTIGLENALFWAIVIFLISYIPVVGGLVSSVAPALFALVQFPTFWQAATIFLAIQSVPIRLTPTPTTSRFCGAVLSASRPRWADILWAQSE